MVNELGNGTGLSGMEPECERGECVDDTGAGSLSRGSGRRTGSPNCSEAAVVESILSVGKGDPLSAA